MAKKIVVEGSALLARFSITIAENAVKNLEVQGWEGNRTRWVRFNPVFYMSHKASCKCVLNIVKTKALAEGLRVDWVDGGKFLRIRVKKPEVAPTV